MKKGHKKDCECWDCQNRTLNLERQAVEKYIKKPDIDRALQIAQENMNGNDTLNRD